MPRPVQLITWALVAAALLLSIIALTREPRARTASAPGQQCACDDKALRDEIAELKARVAGLSLAASRMSDRLAQLNTAVVPLVGAGGSDPTADPTASAATPRKYTRFEAPTGIAITSSADGAIAVTNSDPTRTGQVVIIKGYREDGSIDEFPITVPPP